MAGIIKKARFIQPGQDVFNMYIEYIDRDEAVRDKGFDKFNLFHDYMGDPEKSSGLFDSTGYLTDAKKKEYKEKFEAAQEKGSCLFQEVFSFDSVFLEQFGILDPDTGLFHEETLMNYAILAIEKMLDKENFASAAWVASIHKNTEHYHIHVAMVDSDVSWKEGEGRCFCEKKSGKLMQRGKISPKALNAGVSELANLLTKEADKTRIINNIMRDGILGSIKTDRHLLKDPELTRMVINLIEELPDDIRLWKYNNNAMKSYRRMIDDISDYVVYKYYPKEMLQLNDILDKQQELNIFKYGASAKTFKDNKKSDLYSRLGNCVLSSARSIKKADYYSDYRKAFSTRNYKNALSSYKSHVQMNRAIGQMNYAMYKSSQEFRNTLIYQREFSELDRG